MMMAPEPLRSAMTIGSAEDTSLAVPWDNKLRTGQQRVLDQVHTIKRSKSRPGKNGSASPSPTNLTPQIWTTNTEFSLFKFSPSKANGTFSRSNSTMSTGYNKVRAKGQAVQSQNVQTRVNRHSLYSVTNGTQMTNSQTRIVRPPSALSHTEGKMGTIKTSKTELQQTAVSSGINISDLTLKEAIEFLCHPDENFKQCGATFIQHTTFKEESAKQEVFQLGGIPLLVTLLRSPSPGVSQAAAGALRNLVFKNHNNKLEVQHCDGIAKSLQLLKETDSTETQKQITGLLWNMSSADELKAELTVTAMPVLTEHVVVPFTSWSDNTTNNNIHPDVFYNATGCLRNLSCAQRTERQAMRDCHGLIDSLMSYVQSCVAEENSDDKSVENCVCILHNLTYQLETESPLCFSKYSPQQEGRQSTKSPTIGCFSPKSSKAQKQFSYDVDRAMPEDSTPSGAEWLCHPKAMQTYLSLLGSSQKDATLEACCGALQNLTACRGRGSDAISKILVQKLGALLHLPPLLKSPNCNLQKTTMSLLSNMSRISTLQTPMAKQILPALTSLLSSGPREMGKSDDNIATACSTARTLLFADTEVSKKVINNELVTSLADLSENGSYPKGKKAAALLLYSLWNEKNLQGVVKKLGMAKSLFVNDNTTAAHKSVQVIE
ncbi:plakophilin-1 isoform X2 [Toxotes jaculatrix]|uniref:plakophilin-1 isoform X2 n=1 Tax=Toxotes jaculatrix TaxID=941984 RepID=UPI001B3AC121|nr:plakophilin-1 isoform X2 [Toxotes jaculatrix]